MSKIIAICGKICSGKTYYANRIKEKEKAIILSTDEVTYYLTGNEQGVNYDELCAKISAYLMKKSVEIVNIGCSVILDWEFWTSIQKKKLRIIIKSAIMPLNGITWILILNHGNAIFKQEIKKSKTVQVILFFMLMKVLNRSYQINGNSPMKVKLMCGTAHH